MTVRIEQYKGKNLTSELIELVESRQDLPPTITRTNYPVLLGIGVTE